MTYTTTSLGHVVRVARQAAKLTQAELGTAAGYAVKGAGVSISRIEAGDMRPSAQSLAGIATALGMSVDLLEARAEAAATDEAPAPKPLKQRLQDLQRVTDRRTETMARLADSFAEAHDRARDEFFVPFVIHAQRVLEAPLPPAPERLLDAHRASGELGAAFRVEMASSTLAASLAGAAGGAAIGTLAGSAAAYAAIAATAALGTASTGAPIAGLTGVAATNATLATLGGGARAAGGAGMTGGAMVLAGIVAAPAALAAVGGYLWMSRRSKQKEKETAEKLDLAEQEVAATQAGFDALVEVLADATRVFDYIRTHAAHAEQRWAVRLGEDPVDWSSLDARAQAEYQDFLTIAGCQIAVAGIDAGAFMVNRGADLEALVASTDEILQHAERTIAELV